MNKRLLFYLLLLFSAFFLPATTSANPNENTYPATADEAINCPAPSPGWLIVTNVTPTSVSLMWEQAQANMYFKVEGYDITGGFPLTTQYVSNNTTTFNNLTPGNYYKFGVSASYCPGGPFGDTIAVYRRTPSIIIIDDLVELRGPCTPDNQQSVGLGTQFTICVPKSSYFSAPFNNAFIGQLKYNDNNTLDFTVVYNGSDAYVGKTETNSNFDFEYTPNTSTNSSATCYFLPTNPDAEVLTVNNMSINPANPDEAHLTITFFGSFNFNYCNSCLMERSTGSNPTGISPEEEATLSPENAIMTQVNPNPFHESATFRYSLPESGPVEISLYDAMGQQVKAIEKTTLQAAGDYEVTVEGANLPAGVYFLHTMTGQTRKVFALVKRE